MDIAFHETNFKKICNKLSGKDADLKFILKNYGYPPIWTRSNSFATLIHIILEQQVSLASARAAFDKLKEKLGAITPKKLITLSDKEMKACYFSRQKIVYARHLSNAFISGKLKLKKIPPLTNDEIRNQLIQIKGIGDWTVDVYLMHALQRTDLFPLGDIALVNSLKEVKQLHSHISKEEMLKIVEPWRPYRTIAAMILWHAYIQKRGIKIQG